MHYSLLAGGKRLRPVLLFASYETFQMEHAKTLRTALALEMIHTYSLIHDDLPAMDDDDYRRGALTNHRKFDEATAILAGDALLTYSFELIATDPLLSDTEKLYILQALTKASGPEGMVAGQILDIEGESMELSLKDLEKIHQYKTGALISFAITAGAYLAKVSTSQLGYLQQFAYYLGLIFQVQDDILDIVGDPEKIGKPVGSDTANEKSTYPSLLGIDGAIKQKDVYVNNAIKALQLAKAEHGYLHGLLHYFSQREY
jgi:geranylgeranyl diphosphate synthase type II